MYPSWLDSRLSLTGRYRRNPAEKYDKAHKAIPGNGSPLFRERSRNPASRGHVDPFRSRETRGRRQIRLEISRTREVFARVLADPQTRAVRRIEAFDVNVQSVIFLSERPITLYPLIASTYFKGPYLFSVSSHAIAYGAGSPSVSIRLPRNYLSSGEQYRCISRDVTFSKLHGAALNALHSRIDLHESVPRDHRPFLASPPPRQR